LSHQETDRVPLDMWGTDSRLIDEFYFKVLDHLGWTEKGEIERPGKTAQYVDWKLADLFDCDFRHITARAPEGFVRRTDAEGHSYDEWGVGYQKMGEHSFISKHPFPEPDIAAIAKFPWPDMADPSRFRGMEQRVREWFETTDYAITTTTPFSGLIMDIYQYLRGTEDFFMDLYEEPDFAHALIEKIAELMETLHVEMVRPLAPYLTWVEFATDYGTQNGPFLSPEKYREFLKGPEARIFAAVKKVAPGAKIFMHSCGSIKRLIPDLIEAGIEILSALQPLAFEMNSAELKKEFGRDLVFHGGIDLQQAMVGTREQIVAETLTRLRDYAPGGGYVCAPSNHFTSDVPVENFFAMYETARDWRIGQ
jgi:uroporphyrinogen decarboxylase